MAKDDWTPTGKEIAEAQVEKHADAAPPTLQFFCGRDDGSVDLIDCDGAVLMRDVPDDLPPLLGAIRILIVPSGKFLPTPHKPEDNANA